MNEVWLRFGGLAPSTTTEDIHALAGNRATDIEFEGLAGVEAQGRFRLESLRDAVAVLDSVNYTVYRGHSVRLWLDDEVLGACVQVVFVGIVPTSGEETRMYEFSRSFGTLCHMATGEGLVRVWMYSEADLDARTEAMVVRARNGGYYQQRLDAYIDSTEHVVIEGPSTSSGYESMVISDGDSDEVMHIDTIPTPTSAPGASDPWPPVPRRKAKASARKTTRAGSDVGTAAPSDQTQPETSSPMPRASSSPTLPGPQTVEPMVSRGARKSTRRQKAGVGSARRGRHYKASPTALHRPPTGHPGIARSKSDDYAYVRNIVDMKEWRAQAPFIYDFIYRGVPEASSGESRFCLSMAWSPGPGAGMVNCFQSLGNLATSEIVNEVPVSSDEEAPMTAITMTTFDLPPRGCNADVRSLLGAFNSDEVRILHKNLLKDDNNNKAISALKLHTDGQILFGCTGREVLVWTTDEIRQREMLLLLDDVDGQYDAGRDYVVANSQKGEMGVWKAGSRNYMWRYNDTRRFRSTLALAYSTPVITALRVAASDAGAYVGDMSESISFSDFREPYIQPIATGSFGVPQCIDIAGENELLVGTHNGVVSLLDTRFVHTSKPAASVMQYRMPSSAVVSGLRMCPHDPRFFACSVGSNVHIYDKTLADPDALVFSHGAHQTKVMDFDWHPDSESKYTIGSIELGTERGFGEIQVWRPTDDIMQSCIF